MWSIKKFSPGSPLPLAVADRPHPRKPPSHSLALEETAVPNASQPQLKHVGSASSQQQKTLQHQPQPLCGLGLIFKSIRKGQSEAAVRLRGSRLAHDLRSWPIGLEPSSVWEAGSARIENGWRSRAVWIGLRAPARRGWTRTRLSEGLFALSCQQGECSPWVPALAAGVREPRALWGLLGGDPCGMALLGTEAAASSHPRA